MVARAPILFRLADIYDRVATYPRDDFDFHCGAAYAHRRLGYDAQALDRLPRLATACFVGVGQPLSLGPVESGQRVLDIGCGAGTDVLLAAEKVGPTGVVLGVDSTARMVERARTAAAQSDLRHVEIREGSASALPVGDAAVQVVLSNGLLHDARDRGAVVREMARVLEPGGRVMSSEIVVDDPAPSEGWLAGAMTLDDLRAYLSAAGLVDIRVVCRWDPFAGTPVEALARSLGACSVGIVARKPGPR